MTFIQPGGILMISYTTWWKYTTRWKYVQPGGNSTTFTQAGENGTIFIQAGEKLMTFYTTW